MLTPPQYNFVLSAAFSASIAISGLVQFFGLAYNDITIKWWGNTIIAAGCEAGGCVKKFLPEDQPYFGPAPGNFN